MSLKTECFSTFFDIVLFLFCFFDFIFVFYSPSFSSWSCFLLSFVFISGLQACNFIKKRLQQRCFPVKFVKF